MNEQQDGAKRNERWWRELIEKQSKTSEAVTALCQRHGVKPCTFYWWQKQIRKKATEQFTPVEVGMVNEYEVRCCNGRSIVIRGAVSPSILASILCVVEGERNDAAK